MALPLSANRRDPAPAFFATIADEVTREAVRQAAAQFGWPAARVRDGGAAAAQEALKEMASPAILLVDVSDSLDPIADLDALAELCEPHTKVLALGRTNDIGLYRALMRMGVSEYLVKPVSAEALVDALRRAQQVEAAAPDPAGAARVYAFVGARGGVGTTSLAVSAAWSLANEHGKRTVLLDLDLQFGAAALSLDLEPGRGLREILANPERIDSLLVSSAMTHAGDQFRILGAEEPLEDDTEVSPAALQALLASMNDACDAVVVDVPRRIDRAAREVLTRADVVVVVTDLSLPAMRDAQRLARLLKTLRPAGNVLIVGNRVGGTLAELPQAEFARGLGAPLAFAAPTDAKAAEAAAEQAKPLLEAAGKGPLAVELRRLTARLADADDAPIEAAEPASWLKRVLGR
ncbi:MAG: pilus assembly protein CpaE [Phenylobacterium sp.]|nr:MAG: pilus assembly protein CpaE [Phenylobacterium sp.]